MPKEQEKSLVALGQLWGFLKYHHPVVSEGKLDWDAELIEMIPTIMNTQNENEWRPHYKPPKHYRSFQKAHQLK